MPTFSIGIDPGYEEAGIVLLDPAGMVVEYGLVKDQYGPTFPTCLRSQAVAVRLVQQVRDWVALYWIKDLGAAVEMPIYNGNAAGYGKQYTQVQAIESLLMDHVAPLLENFTLCEPHPGESKHAATGSGSATKAEMFAASPFAQMSVLMEGHSEHSRQTLSDAWAHALTVRAPGTKCYGPSQLCWWPRVEE